MESGVGGVWVIQVGGRRIVGLESLGVVVQRGYVVRRQRVARIR